MSQKTFSKKEAISHGFTMTKKYFKVIFITLIIYAVYNFISGGLSDGAGVHRISRMEVLSLYKDRTQANNFYQYLVSAGYINNLGSRQPQLENLKMPSELVLPPELEADRIRIFEFLVPYTYRLPFSKPVYFLLAFILWVGSIFMGVGLLKMSLLFARDQEPALSELYSNGPLILSYLLASIAYGLGVFGGILLLIIPGIIFMIMWGMYPYFIIDRNLGPIASLKASSLMTQGVRGQLFLFGLLLLLVNLGGALCLLIGLIFTIPATYIASAYVYDQLLKFEPEAVV